MVVDEQLVMVVSNGGYDIETFLVVSNGAVGKWRLATNAQWVGQLVDCSRKTFVLAGDAAVDTKQETSTAT